MADASGAGIVKTLRETYGFEYYIMDRKMTWLLCENHHEMLIEAKADVKKRNVRRRIRESGEAS